MEGMKPLAGKNIAIMVASGFIEEHMTDVQKALIAAGAMTTIVSPEVGVANGWHEGGWGHNFFVDERISDVLPSQYDLLLAPGGVRSTATLAGNAHSRRVLKGMLEANKPVALTDDAATLLIDAEVASGRSVSAPEAAAERLTAAGVTVSNEGVTVDGSLITMANTSGASEFIAAIKASLGAVVDVEEEAA